MESDTLLDLCVTNHELSSILAGVLTFDLSDHLPIFCFFPRLMSKRKKPPTQEVLYLSYNQYNLAAFRSMAESISWSNNYNEKNPSIAYDIFVELIKDKYNRAFPLLLKKTNKKSRKPWVTRELYKRIQTRDKLFHKFIKIKDPVLLNEYKKLETTKTLTSKSPERILQE